MSNIRPRVPGELLMPFVVVSKSVDGKITHYRAYDEDEYDHNFASAKYAHGITPGEAVDALIDNLPLGTLNKYSEQILDLKRGVEGVSNFSQDHKHWSEWVSVDEELPKNESDMNGCTSIDVLCKCIDVDNDKVFMTVAYVNKKDNRWYVRDEYGCWVYPQENIVVTHWIYLPE